MKRTFIRRRPAVNGWAWTWSMPDGFDHFGRDFRYSRAAGPYRKAPR